MVGAIIQARMGSERLPGKVLLEIEGKPMLLHIVERLKSCRLIDEIIIATSHNAEDDAIAELAKEHSIPVVRGSGDNVLSRFYKAAKKIRADVIVRITGDNPLLDPAVIDRVIREYLKGGCDCATNSIIRTYPDGLDIEVFSFEALKKAWRNAQSRIEKEHVTPYIKNSGHFRVKNVTNEKGDLSLNFRWTVDEPRDLEFARAVYKHLYSKGKIFYMKDVLDLLKRHPEIQKINSSIPTNEGYYKSFIKEPPVKPRRISIKRSLIFKKRAKAVIPLCSQTFSKAPTQFVQNVAPVFLEKGKDSHVWDVDGNEFVDYSMALAPVILGYNYPAVTKAVKKYLELGTTFTLPHRLEVELAELLKRTIPCAEMARFGKNGSDATSGAIRAARAYTGRDKIACCGYHGWQDWYIGTTTRDKGIPEGVKKLTLTFKYNDIESLEKIFKENRNKIAAVIMEPMGVVEPQANFLSKAKELAHKNGALFIFDEIITGFRLSLGGAQEYFNVIPDLSCFGKAMGNGFPISAVVGKRKIMKLFEDVFFSFTFGGDIISIAASIAAINEIKNRNVITHLWEMGRRLKDGYNVLAKEYGVADITQCMGLPPRTVITFKDKRQRDDLVLKSLFQQECIKRKVLFTGAHNVSFSHTASDVDYTLKVYRTVLEIAAKAVRRGNAKGLLEGPALEPVFRRP